ncbi:MAG: replicative DNA helicase [Alphaproteobacteria bacterium]|nr:replicative DNA helicase [Alphaproteobacteria bacterium]OJV13871.1 MAG: replicative DNA helicase [Alphaproteobacteria bacterium 33-17]
MADVRVVPHNIEAEQIVLGHLIYDNDSINKFGEYLTADHFYVPVHRKIYETVLSLIDRGLYVTPVILKNYLDNDQAFENGDSNAYLNQLVALSSTVLNISDYAKLIYDLALKRDLIRISEDTINGAYEGKNEASTQIEMCEQRLFELASSGHSETGAMHYKKAMELSLKKIEFAINNKENVVGVSTGFRDLDKILAGLQRSDLLILAGRPSMGKTAFAINMAYNSCLFFRNNPDEDGKPKSVGFFSLEMSGEQLTSRILSMVSGIDAATLRNGTVSQYDFAKISDVCKEISQNPFYIDDTPALSISALRTRARRMKRVHNVGAIFIDYLQLLRGSSNNEGNRVQEISEITQGLKAIAKELDIPVIALSQLSRAVEQREDKRPLLSDLRESGSIEQDADVVMFIYRDSYYLERKYNGSPSPEIEAKLARVKNLSEIIIAKQRNGPIGNVTLKFSSNTTRFADHNEERGYSEYEGA